MTMTLDEIPLDITWCPQCAQPAEVTARYVLNSTDGPIEMVRIQCVNRHWFNLPLDRL